MAMAEVMAHQTVGQNPKNGYGGALLQSGDVVQSHDQRNLRHHPRHPYHPLSHKCCRHLRSFSNAASVECIISLLPLFPLSLPAEYPPQFADTEVLLVVMEREPESRELDVVAGALA
jgi:hypothetical protein